MSINESLNKINKSLIAANENIKFNSENGFWLLDSFNYKQFQIENMSLHEYNDFPSKMINRIEDKNFKFIQTEIFKMLKMYEEESIDIMRKLLLKLQRCWEFHIDGKIDQMKHRNNDIENMSQHLYKNINQILNAIIKNKKQLYLELKKYKKVEIDSFQKINTLNQSKDTTATTVTTTRSVPIATTIVDDGNTDVYNYNENKCSVSNGSTIKNVFIEKKGDLMILEREKNHIIHKLESSNRLLEYELKVKSEHIENLENDMKTMKEGYKDREKMFIECNKTIDTLEKNNLSVEMQLSHFQEISKSLEQKNNQFKEEIKELKVQNQRLQHQLNESLDKLNLELKNIYHEKIEIECELIRSRVKYQDRNLQIGHITKSIDPALKINSVVEKSSSSNKIDKNSSNKIKEHNKQIESVSIINKNEKTKIEKIESQNNQLKNKTKDLNGNLSLRQLIQNQLDLERDIEQYLNNLIKN